jgi:hypothetical protein
MVTEKTIAGNRMFLCEVCGFGYLDKETAQKCEDWCRKTGTCSLEITKKAVYFPDPFETFLQKKGEKTRK